MDTRSPILQPSSQFNVAVNAFIISVLFQFILNVIMMNEE